MSHPIVLLLRQYVIREIELYIARQQARAIINNLVKSIKVKVDIKPGLRLLDQTEKQVRFATVVALTRTAKRIEKLAEEEIRRVFDRPTSFVQRAFYTKQANKVSLEAVVGIKDRQAKVLRPHIVGGGRERKPFEQKLVSDSNKADGYWVPGEGIRLDARGNMTKGQIAQIAAGLRRTGKFAEVFVGVPAGHPGAPFGIWGRKIKGRGNKALAGIVPLLVRINAPRYKKRFDFQGLANKHAQRIFNEEFERAFRQATASAR